MKKYTYEDVYKKTLEYFNNDTLATSVFIDKYTLKDSNNNYYEIDPTDMHKRLAKEFAKTENEFLNKVKPKNYENNLSEYGKVREHLTEEKIFKLFDRFKYVIPQGSIMSVLGNPFTFSSLSNCIVLPDIYDSYGGIFYADQQLAQFQKRRCGTGLDISNLRPTGTNVNNSALTSTGMTSFMDRFSNTTKEVAQGGRRGALMLSCSVHSPSIEEFIDIKQQKDANGNFYRVTGANVSVKLTDAFMNAVINKQKYIQQFPIESEFPEIKKEVDAYTIWKKIIKSAHNSAEPGLLFWDKQHAYSTSSMYPGFKNISTNPCVSGDTLVTTDKGNILIKDLVDNFDKYKDYKILSYNIEKDTLEYENLDNAILSKYNANIIELELSDGSTIKLTPDHKVYTKNRGWIEAGKLNIDDILIGIEWELKLKKINIIENENVYDISVSKNHNFFGNGLLIHNCAEIAMNNDSCRLICLNLFGFVNNPFTSNVDFDFDLFYKYTYEAQRLMDDLVELELNQIQKIITKIKNDTEPDYIKAIELKTWEDLYENGRLGRRTGLGFTALADLIAGHNLKYDSDESMTLVDKIMRTKLQAEFDASVDMAIERGKFEIFDAIIEEQSEFIQMIKNEFNPLYQRMMKFGRRNISISCVAPTGSVSILTQTSSGIEPVFQLEYIRRRKIYKDSTEEFDTIDDSGEKWKNFVVYHNKLQDWMILNNNSNIEESPYFKSTANDIDWERRIKMQSIIGKYITHSISSTINLPSTVTIDEVEKIYLKAWKYGLKGITVYRDGSRSGVLINKDSKKSQVKENNVAKRPKILDCDVKRFVNKGEKWICFIGLCEGAPYEIFTGKLDAIKIPNNIEKGKIHKIKTENGSVYNFIYEYSNETYTVESLNKIFDETYWNIAKMISGLLRHGMPVKYIVNLINSLKLDGDLITTWKAGVIRMLSQYIPDGTLSDKVCEKCGNKSMVYTSKCPVCTICGHNSCGL